MAFILFNCRSFYESKSMAKVYINIVHILFWSWVGAKVTLSFILLVLIHKNAEACWHFWYNLCDWVGLIYFWQLICLNFSIYYLFSLLCICSHFFLELLAVFEGLCRIYRSISCWFTFATRIASFHFSLGSLFEINKFWDHANASPKVTFFIQKS